MPPAQQSRERLETLTVLHAGAGWQPPGPTGLEYGTLLVRKLELIPGFAQVGLHSY